MTTIILTLTMTLAGPNHTRCLADWSDCHWASYQRWCVDGDWDAHARRVEECTRAYDICRWREMVRWAKEILAV